MASAPDGKAKADDKSADSDKTEGLKKTGVHHAKYHNGEGSTWKTGRNSYGLKVPTAAANSAAMPVLMAIIDKAC